MREKYVKGYFVLSRLLVSDFLLFNVLFWSSVKKFKVLGCRILESRVLGPRSQVLHPGSRVPGPRSWVSDPGSRVLCPYFRLYHLSSLKLTFLVISKSASPYILDFCIFVSSTFILFKDHCRNLTDNLKEYSDETLSIF